MRDRRQRRLGGGLGRQRSVSNPGRREVRWIKSHPPRRRPSSNHGANGSETSSPSGPTLLFHPEFPKAARPRRRPGVAPMLTGGGGPSLHSHAHTGRKTKLLMHAEPGWPPRDRTARHRRRKTPTLSSQRHHHRSLGDMIKAAGRRAAAGALKHQGGRRWSTFCPVFCPPVSSAGADAALTSCCAALKGSPSDSNTASL